MAGFTTNRSQKWNGIITALFALAWAGAAQAATLNVDINDVGCSDVVGTPYCTIQAAIDDAADGDTILVYDGTYDIIDINVENLTVISLNGAGTTTIEYTGNTDTTPVVAITADGVTLGGAGAGFTIDQQDAFAVPESGNAGVKVDGSVVGPDSVTIQNNTFIGNEAGAGVLVILPIENGHLVVQNNTFEKAGGAAFSFTDIMHFHFADFGGNIGNAAAHTATIDLLSNTADDFGRSGVYFHHDLYSSTVNITGSTFDGNGADYGIYFANDLRAFSNVTIDNTTFNDVDYGLYMSGGLLTQSSMSWINGSMVTDFHDSGLYISSSVDELSTLTIDLATFAGDGSASYGVYISGEVEQGATFTLTGSTISGFEDYGVYVDAEDGGAYAITGNTITGSSARYGIYVDHIDGSQGLIDDNTITGFGDPASTSYGIYVSDQYEGTIVNIDNNTITADASASDTYGVYFSYAPNYGASGSFSGNTVSGFNYAGMYVDDGPYYGSDFDVDGNTFTAHADGSDYGIYWYEIYDGSHATFTNNTVSGFGNQGTEYGFYLYSVYEGSTLTATGNTFTAHADGADYGLYVSSDIEEASTFIFSDNTVSNFDYAGFYHDGYVEYDGTLTVDDNTFTAHTDGADYGAYFYECYEGGHCSFNGNTVTGFDEYGLYVYYVEYGNDFTGNGNTFTGHSDGPDYGAYFEDINYGATVEFNGNVVTGFDYAGMYIDDIDDGSHLTANNNTFTADATDGADYGIYLYDLDDGSTATFDGNVVSNFGNQGSGDYGFYVDYIEYGSILTITNNTFTAHPDKAEYGFYSYDGLDYGSDLIFTGNTLSGFDYAGVYVDDYIEDGSDAWFNNNTLTAHADGADYGIYFDDALEEGGETHVDDNTVSGFTDTGIYVYYVDDGYTLTVDGNTLTAHTDGADYGIYNDGVEDGSTASFNGNTITGIKNGSGMWFYDSWYGSTMEVCGNTITPHADGSDYGIYFSYPSGGGGELTICKNDVSGFSNTSLYFDNSSYDGALLDIIGNSFDGGDYGIYFNDSLEAGLLGAISQNTLTGFMVDGIYFADVLEGTDLIIDNNKFVGGSTDAGIYFDGDIQEASFVDIMDNCFQNLAADDGVRIYDILDSSVVRINGNDFAATLTGINNVNGDAAHAIDGDDNWWGVAAGPNAGGSATIGEVDVASSLAGQPDSDNDGVMQCDDICPDTPGAEAADSDGCSCSQKDDDGDTVNNCDDQCAGQDDLLDANGNNIADCLEGGGGGGGGGIADIDGDGVADATDNCLNDANTNQADADADGVGDVCDQCPGFDDSLDTDGDGTIDGCDECPEDANKVAAGLCGCGLDDSLDADNDGTPDCLDLCPGRNDRLDTDGDGTVDCFDGCPADGGKTAPGQCGCGTPDDDPDADGFASCNDNCPNDANANQSDLDSDGLGDVCDDDVDGDGVAFAADLCRGTAQGAAVNADGCSEDQVQIVIEPAGDGTQEDPLDSDGDGVADDVDNCPNEAGTAANNGCPEETTDLCGSGLCNPGGASLALLFGLMLMRFGYRRPIRRA